MPLRNICLVNVTETGYAISNSLSGIAFVVIFVEKKNNSWCHLTIFYFILYIEQISRSENVSWIIYLDMNINQTL